MALIKRFWSEDGVYSDPHAMTEPGAAGLDEAIVKFQRDFPGVRFRCGVPQVHHTTMRHNWLAINPDGSVKWSGTEFSELASDGRIRRVVSEALARGARRVLVDVRGLSGFEKPDVTARLGMVRRWAATTQGRLKVAMISPPELNDGERFDVVFANSLGFDGDVFETEADARRWLDELPRDWEGAKRVP
jgi:hypothetical protein